MALPHYGVPMDKGMISMAKVLSVGIAVCTQSVLVGLQRKTVDARHTNTELLAQQDRLVRLRSFYKVCPSILAHVLAVSTPQSLSVVDEELGKKENARFLLCEASSQGGYEQPAEHVRQDYRKLVEKLVDLQNKQLTEALCATAHCREGILAYVTPNCCWHCSASRRIRLGFALATGLLWWQFLNTYS